jgi:putative membrane protein
MASSGDVDTTTVILLLVGVLVVLPFVPMGMGGMMGYGHMTGWSGTGTGWWPLVGLLGRLLVVVVLLGGGYLIVRRATATGAGRDPAMAELRQAYARGDLTDEEFEERRERLDRAE